MSQPQPLLNPATQLQAFFRRVLASDFRSEKPTDWEMHRMGAHGAAPRLAHSYTAWRSSLLYAAAGLLLFATIWNLATYTSGQEAILEVFTTLQGFLTGNAEPTPAVRELAETNGSVIDLSTLTSRISALVAVGIIVTAGVLWPRVRISVILARIAWIILFGVPFVMALLPLSSMMDYGNMDPRFVPFLELLLGGTFGITVFLGLLPKALSLFPGLIRSSMALKTLLPESRAPGWITVLLAPLFGLFLWLLMATINQFPNTAAILVGVMCILAGQVVYIVMAPHIVRGYTKLPGKVIWPRRLSALLGIAGVLIIFFRLVTMDNADVGGTISGLIGIFGNVLLLSVVCSDFLLPQLRTSHRMTRQFVESDMFDDLGTKCDDLSLTLSRDRALPKGSEAVAAKPATPLETVEAKAVDEVETVQAKPVDTDES
jgi:hypothetical protein